jgi:excinuclease ABC subunit B
MPTRLRPACKKTIDQTNYRREKQINYNKEHNLVPKALNKKIDSTLARNSVSTQYFEKQAMKAAEPESQYLTKPEIEKKNP